MARVDVPGCGSVHQFQTGPSECASCRRIGMLDQQPRGIRSVLADQRAAWPSALVDDLPEPLQPGGILSFKAVARRAPIVVVLSSEFDQLRAKTLVRRHAPKYHDGRARAPCDRQ